MLLCTQIFCQHPKTQMSYTLIQRKVMCTLQGRMGHHDRLVSGLVTIPTNNCILTLSNA